MDEFFVDALGGLFSVVAQDIKIDVSLNYSDANFAKFFAGKVVVSKTYGDMWVCEEKDKKYSISIKQLISGVSRDFIFELTVPALGVSQLEDFERNAEIVKVAVTGVPLNPQYVTSVHKETGLVLTLFTELEQVAHDSEFHDDVEFNYLRVQAAEAMKNAI